MTAGGVTGEGAARGTGVLTRGTVVIDVEACKGCDLCIDACPPRVLVMTTDRVNTRGYRYPELLPGCTGCRACSQICPDFVFQVYKYDTPVLLGEAP
ncbi:MAG TPA: 4Fe-4S dicluster domain-containing protein [Acidimicrobiales bacterium]|nr:4Fe-4S dicluster domain-containing protein [Acidimicrobiales bacterium]